MSILEYSSTDWDPFYQKDIDRFETVQRRAAIFFGVTENLSAVQQAWHPNLVENHSQKEDDNTVLPYFMK